MSKQRWSKLKTRGTSVEVRNDDVTRALRTFNKKIQEQGLLKDLRDRMSYEPPAVKKQKLKKAARKRWERLVEEMIRTGRWHHERSY